MADESLTITEGETYDHDDHGEVEVINVYREVRGVSVERNDDRTTTDIDPMVEYRIHYEYDGGIRRDDDKLEDFQHKLSAD